MARIEHLFIAVVHGFPVQESGEVWAILEVSGPCHPCSRMEEIRKGLQEELRGRRGILCRVVRAGRTRRGDAIDKVAAAVGAGV